jgi:hypothetical protein
MMTIAGLAEARLSVGVDGGLGAVTLDLIGADLDRGAHALLDEEAALLVALGGEPLTADRVRAEAPALWGRSRRDDAGRTRPDPG